MQKPASHINAIIYFMLDISNYLMPDSAKRPMGSSMAETKILTSIDRSDSHQPEPCFLPFQRSCSFHTALEMHSEFLTLPALFCMAVSSVTQLPSQALKTMCWGARRSDSSRTDTLKHRMKVPQRLPNPRVQAGMG